MCHYADAVILLWLLNLFQCLWTRTPALLFLFKCPMERTSEIPWKVNVLDRLYELYKSSAIYSLLVRFMQGSMSYPVAMRSEVFMAVKNSSKPSSAMVPMTTSGSFWNMVLLPLVINTAWCTLTQVRMPWLLAKWAECGVIAKLTFFIFHFYSYSEVVS